MLIHPYKQGGQDNSRSRRDNRIRKRVARYDFHNVAVHTHSYIVTLFDISMINQSFQSMHGCYIKVSIQS